MPRNKTPQENTPLLHSHNIPTSLTKYVIEGIKTMLLKSLDDIDAIFKEGVDSVNEACAHSPKEGQLMQFFEKRASYSDKEALVQRLSQRKHVDSSDLNRMSASKDSIIKLATENFRDTIDAIRSDDPQHMIDALLTIKNNLAEQYPVEPLEFARLYSAVNSTLDDLGISQSCALSAGPR